MLEKSPAEIKTKKIICDPEVIVTTYQVYLIASESKIPTLTTPRSGRPQE